MTFNLLDHFWLIPALLFALTVLCWWVIITGRDWLTRWRLRRFNTHREVYGGATYYALKTPRPNIRRP